MTRVQIHENTGDEIMRSNDPVTACDENTCSVKSRGDHIAGFTLVEVTLALGVAAICLIPLIGLLPTSLRTQQSSIQQTTANQILSQLSSFLRADVRLPPGQASKACPDPPDPNEPCDWSNLNGHWRNVATPDTMYFTNEAKPTGTVTQPNNVPADAAFRAKITYMTPPTQTTSLASIRVTWPAAIDPDSGMPAGSVTSLLAVNR
jgi:type II secretory pathway pseudopilin PulG